MKLLDCEPSQVRRATTEEWSSLKERGRVSRGVCRFSSGCGPGYGHAGPGPGRGGSASHSSASLMLPWLKWQNTKTMFAGRACLSCLSGVGCLARSWWWRDGCRGGGSEPWPATWLVAAAPVAAMVAAMVRRRRRCRARAWVITARGGMTVPPYLRDAVAIASRAGRCPARGRVGGPACRAGTGRACQAQGVAPR